MQLLKRVDCAFYQTKGTTIFLIVTESVKLLLCNFFFENYLAG